MERRETGSGETGNIFLKLILISQEASPFRVGRNATTPPRMSSFRPTLWPAGAGPKERAATDFGERGFDPLLVFGGDLRLAPQSAAYSGGMRQAIARVAANASAIEPAADGTSPPPLRILPHVHDHEWRRAKYCLAVSGDGWGNRLMKSFLLNCVPVIAAPLVVQPFEALLDFRELARCDPPRCAQQNRRPDAPRPRPRAGRLRLGRPRGPRVQCDATRPLPPRCRAPRRARRPAARRRGGVRATRGRRPWRKRARARPWFSPQLARAIRTVQAERRAAMLAPG